MEGRVLKKNTDHFDILSHDRVYSVVGRKNLKRNGIFVGDKVIFNDKSMIVEKICERKNLLIRPPMANLDKLFIVIAKVPKPDLYLVDKIIIFCDINKIEPILLINKCDENGSEFIENIEKKYKKVLKIIKISAKSGDFSDFIDEIEGVCALAGQSAVGKSSIINSLFKEAKEEVGNLSKKVERGKQTTRIVTLYKLKENAFLADTAGFSKLDETLIDLDFNDLKNYYPEFLEYAHDCKYRSCLHINDKDCAILKKVKQGEIDKDRYENYLKFLNTLKNIQKY